MLITVGSQGQLHKHRSKHLRGGSSITFKHSIDIAYYHNVFIIVVMGCCCINVARLEHFCVCSYILANQFLFMLTVTENAGRAPTCACRLR